RRAATSSLPPDLPRSSALPALLACAARRLAGLALLASCAALAPAFAAEPAPVARGGIIDLSAAAMSHAEPLQGEWGFAWGRFLSPVEQQAPSAFAPVPGIWNELAADGKPPGPDGAATYTLLVRCPEGQQLALSVP